MARDGERGRGDWKARLGSRNSGPYAGGSGDTGPVDIAAVRRDDALIDAIASDGPVSTDSTEEYQLATLLVSWRAELIADPPPNEPDLDAVVAAVNQEIGARQARTSVQSSGRLRLLRPIAGTAAALALVIGGMTAFSYDAEPGDPLWRVKEVVFYEQAQTTVVQRADDDLTAAQTLLAQGNPQQARNHLQQASTNATQINDTAKRDNLLVRWNEVFAQLEKVAPEIAKGLAGTVPQSTESRPAGPSGGVTPTKPSTDSTDPTILGTPPGNPGTDGSTTGSESTAPDAIPPVATAPATPTPATPSRTVEPSTQPLPTITAVPTTLVPPRVVVPSAYPSLPNAPTQTPTAGQNSGAIVIPTGSAGGGTTGSVN